MTIKQIHEMISLKEHFEKILAEKDKSLSVIMAANKEAVLVAEKSAEKWRDAANEWRAAMTDREAKFLQKGEFDTYKDSLDKALSDIKKQLDLIAGERKGLRDGWGYLVGIIGVVLGILGYFSK